MAYLALYRKFRPQRFCEVIGQDHIVSTLRNQIAHARIAHAYLFCGTRGTGKTSTAKIFARAVNCHDPQQGEPCGACPACLDPNPIDIIEIDAASNTGVDQTRDLLEKVKFAPVSGKYKLYIIDEVHMLSSSSFNALLKTLEEPPAHVIFILATTEPQKVLATIRSRCQQYEFHRLPTALIASSLGVIASQIGASFDDSALMEIARAAQGGMRDALSLLDQCISFCGNPAGYDDVLSVLGMMDGGFTSGIAAALIRGDCKTVLQGVQRVMDGGRDLAVFCRGLIACLRDVLLINVCGNARELTDLSDETYAACENLAANADKNRLLRAITLLCEAEANMKQLSARVALESALVRACAPQDELSLEAVLDRLSLLERAATAVQVAPIAPAMPVTQAAAPIQAPAKASEPQPAAVPAPEPAPSPEPEPNSAPASYQAGDVFACLKTKLKANLIPLIGDSRQTLEADALTIFLPQRFAAFVTALNSEAGKMQQSIADTYPGIRIIFAEDAAQPDIKAQLRAILGDDIPIYEE